MQTSLIIMICFYILAGTFHFINPKIYLRIIPAWVPYPRLANYLSGACEIIFALMLLSESTRTTGAWLLIFLLIAIFPANIKMAIDFKHKKHKLFWLTVLRLPLQLALIWWAWLFT